MFLFICFLLSAVGRVTLFSHPETAWVVLCSIVCRISNCLYIHTMLMLVKPLNRHSLFNFFFWQALCIGDCLIDQTRAFKTTDGHSKVWFLTLNSEDNMFVCGADPVSKGFVVYKTYSLRHKRIFTLTFALSATMCTVVKIIYNEVQK